ncbi:PRTRC system ThiF family protein [Flavobacterium sp. LHD-85]|uniref:PRTRC system ThiF family protein n=1 Tax=Flavobacterium sp. LHD-85 TaxID=3071410 RepID=UPI0027E1DA31|nr:PRTRC system ThiF family protein [Flavobacterium sp. LHD-85]MDQ6532127.1 PRTRC system ThiF family protein [Flavobacterium sp. LHD-85]
MNADKTKIHFTDSYLISPTNPVTVNLIGAGGTGSKVLTALMEMNHSLTALGHAGISVRLWDDDIVTGANIGRQRFAQCEIGLYKASALINRANRFMGTNWKAEISKFEKDELGRLPQNALASIYITCVDNVKSRFETADILKLYANGRHHRDDPKYWMDFGNSQYAGQVILSTVSEIKQPDSQKYHTVASLPFVTDEFGELLEHSESADDAPSCSLAEALEKQDLFINSALAQMGCSLLWNLFRFGMTENRGFFLNLKNFSSHPLKVG